MNVRKKGITLLLTIMIVLSCVPALNVQAKTTTTTSTSKSTTSDAPNPGTPESKPGALSMSAYTTQSKAQNSAANITSTIGWKKESGYWYYYKSDNTKATGWIKPDNSWYYLASDGSMATGWIKDGGIWYYLDSSGAMSRGWRKVNGLWYYLSDSGAMITGISKVDSAVYYLNSSGSMNTGWVKLNNNWYYFKVDGSMSTGWIVDSSNDYYLYDTGAMAKGWITINGDWYYLNSSGARVGGWVQSGSDYYYLDPSSGKMLTNTQAGGYNISANGKRGTALPATNNTSSSSNTSSGNSSTNSGTNNNKATSTTTPTTPSANTTKPVQNARYKGIDISSYQGSVNFSQVRASGIQCVYIKATEGTTYVDPTLGTYYNGALNAGGLKIGFYHFLVGTSAPETQAENFYNNIKGKQMDLKPVLDIESTGFDVMDYATRFTARFKQLSNMDVCIYTYSSFITNLDSRLAGYKFWEANYNNTPLSNLPSNSIWSTRAGHQYTDSGTVAGINGNVDLDEFTQDILK